MKMLSLLLCVVMLGSTKGQSIDPVSLILAKVIKTVDLKVQRLQNETLVLQRMQQMAEQELAKVKLEEICNWQKQASDLYEEYYAELKQVKPIISSGVLVKRIRSMEESIAVEYKKFPTRAEHIAVFNHSKEIGWMLTVALSNQLSIKDADRLKMLYTLRDAMSRCLETIQELNKQQLALVENRTRVKKELNDVKRLHGIQ